MSNKEPDILKLEILYKYLVLIALGCFLIALLTGCGGDTHAVDDEFTRYMHSLYDEAFVRGVDLPTQRPEVLLGDVPQTPFTGPYACSGEAATISTEVWETLERPCEKEALAFRAMGACYLKVPYENSELMQLQVSQLSEFCTRRTELLDGLFINLK